MLIPFLLFFTNLCIISHFIMPTYLNVITFAIVFGYHAEAELVRLLADGAAVHGIGLGVVGEGFHSVYCKSWASIKTIWRSDDMYVADKQMMIMI
jgi:hypothetical protein